MKKFSTLLLAALLPFCAAAAPAAQSQGAASGAVFVHTLRGNPQVQKGGKSLSDMAGKTVSAEGLEIVCKKNQYVSLKFSNSIVMACSGNSEMSVEEFRQEIPENFDNDGDRENSASTLVLSVKKGTFEFVCRELRAASRFIIKTRAGDFDVRAKMCEIKDNDSSITFRLLDGMAHFKSTNGKSDFLRSKQKATVRNEAIKSNFPLEIEQMGIIEENELFAKLSACRQIKSSIVFYRQNSQILAKRIIFREFMLNPRPYDISK